MTGDDVERVLGAPEKASSEMKGALAALITLVKAERSETSAEVSAEEFVAMVEEGTRCVDVRSPGEYEKGHVPGAVNVPLFNNEERAVVGTRYKRSGRDAAMREGMDFVAKKGIDELARRVRGDATKVVIYCWRGGLRSGAVAWLLRRRQTETFCLVGGYRAFRRWARSQFLHDGLVVHPPEDDDFFALDECVDGPNPPRKEEKGSGRRRIIVLAGRTGVGKTRVLEALAKQGEQIIDLEAVARHRGSAFGYVADQPSNEDFENTLAFQWHRLDERRVWIEDEEGHVGKCLVPFALYDRMQSASLVVRIAAPISVRVDLLVSDYTCDDDDSLIDRLIETTARIEKRLGNERCREAIRLLTEAKEKDQRRRNFNAFANLMLTHYYDKLYDKHLTKRVAVYSDSCTVLDIDACTTSGDESSSSSSFDAEKTATAALEAIAQHYTTTTTRTS